MKLPSAAQVVHVLSTLAALAIALVALLNAAPATTSHEARQQARSNLLIASERSQNAAANNTPTLGCNPAPGGAKAGACAPVQAAAATTTLAKAAGDPFSVFGLGMIGVDVSSYQGCSINWARVRVAFAFFKATEGTGYTDRCLRHNVASAKAAHKPYGVYDFLRPSYAHTAAAEAAHFVAAVRAAGANTSLPPVADVEANAGLSRVAVHNYVCAWHRAVRAALHRTTTITYTGAWFWNPQVAGDGCGSRLWVSAYASYALTPHGFRSKHIWQHSDGIYGPSPHVNGWDTDVYLEARTQAQLRALAGERPAAKPVSAHAHQLCRELVRYRRGLKRGRHPNAHRRRRAGQVRHSLVHGRYRCTKQGRAVRK